MFLSSFLLLVIPITMSNKGKEKSQSRRINVLLSVFLGWKSFNNPSASSPSPRKNLLVLLWWKMKIFPAAISSRTLYWTKGVAKHHHQCSNKWTKCDSFFGIKDDPESRHKLPVKDHNNIMQTGRSSGLKMSLELRLSSFRYLIEAILKLICIICRDNLKFWDYLQSSENVYIQENI